MTYTEHELEFTFAKKCFDILNRLGATHESRADKRTDIIVANAALNNVARL